MAKMLYSATMSLDGFIAAADGDMSWLSAYVGPDQAANELMEMTGALLIGRNTFGGDSPHEDDGGKAFGGAWDGPAFVLTHHPPAKEVDGITFVTDFESAIAKSEAAAGDKFVNILGADVARQCIEAGILDELYIFIVPILLGDGVRLFDHPGGSLVRLERIGSSETELSTALHLRVVK